MNNTYVYVLIAIVAAVTALLRFLPFAVFKNLKHTPPYLTYLGRVLPYAVMGMLVVYCLREASVFSKPYAIPELCACFVTVMLHVLKRNTLLSIFSGTVCYMFLLQVVF